jgi:hypothetical protein
MAIDSVIFGFGYRARAGKDVAVAEIIKQRGLTTADAVLDKTTERYDIRRYAFADALKREVNAAAIAAGGMEKMFNPNRRFAMCNGYYMDFPEWVQYDPNAPMDDPMCPLGKQRSLLQFWGAEYRRAQDGDYWVRKLAQQIELEKPAIACITDMRFLNEMRFVQQYGETVRVDRDCLAPATHISETALADISDENWSIILENNGSLEEFLIGAVTCFDELLTNFPFGANRVAVQGA